MSYKRCLETSARNGGSRFFAYNSYIESSLRRRPGRIVSKDMYNVSDLEHVQNLVLDWRETRGAHT